MFTLNEISGVARSFNWGGLVSLPLSSLPQFVPPLSFPFSIYPLSPFPCPPVLPSPPLLEVGPPNIEVDGVGSAVSSPAGSGAEHQPKSNLVHFSF